MKIKFYFNGIRVNGGPLQSAYVSYYRDEDNENVSVSKKGYDSFPAEVYDIFEVKNHSKLVEDYFDRDRFTVTRFSPYWKNALTAALKGEKRKLDRLNRRAAKHPERAEYMKWDFIGAREAIERIESLLIA